MRPPQHLQGDGIHRRKLGLGASGPNVLISAGVEVLSFKELYPQCKFFFISQASLRERVKRSGEL